MLCGADYGRGLTSDKIQKPKWAKPIKAHGKASARSSTGPEAAEKEADQAEIRARKQTQGDTWQAPTPTRTAPAATVPGNVLTSSFTSIYSTS
jgi:hypothetical protein